MPISQVGPQGEIINGRYRLLEELGHGAMGVVHKAEDTKLDCFVTLKFLHPHLAADSGARQRFIDEAKAASDLNHPNICRIKDHDEAEDGRLYLVMAYYEGGSLEKDIGRGPLPVKKAVDIARQIAAGLSAAHRPTEHRPHGIIHRDIKPSNVLITHDGQAIILDFGIAKIAESGLTGQGDILGTLAYMSPEHLAKGQVSRGTDLWALGVTLYEMLAGERPFQADYEAALRHVIINNDPPPFKDYRKDVSEALAEIIDRCLEKEPDLRYQSAEEIEADLREVAEGGELAWLGRATRRFFRRVRSVAYKRRVPLAMLGALAIVVALLLSPLGAAARDWLGGSRGSDPQHLAVLPLVSSPDDASVGEGLTRALTSLLTQLGSHAERPITVVPASEMREITTPSEARERFRVDGVVSGDFQHKGEQVHLTLNLIDARSLSQRRTEFLIEPANRLYVLQRRSLVALAKMLNVPLSNEMKEMLTTGGTVDPEAYEFFLKGEAALGRSDKPENIDTAIELFQWALRQDSVYAAAYAGLSEAYRYKYTTTRDPQWMPLAETNARRSEALESRLVAAHIALGGVYELRGAHSEAIRELKIAVVLDSLDASAHVGLALALQAAGRYNEAEASFAKAISLQPTLWSHHNYWGEFYLHTGRVEEAVEKFKQVISAAPDNVWGHVNLGAAYLYLNRLGEARESTELANRIQPTAYAYSNLGIIAYFEGDIEEEVRMYERARVLDSLDYATWGNLGSVYDRLAARKQDAIAAYRRAVQLAEAQLVVNPKETEILSDLAGYAAELGERQKAQESIERALALAPDDTYVMAQAARIFEELGLREDALMWIDRALEAGHPREDIEADPALDQLRNDPRYHHVNPSKSN